MKLNEGGNIFKDAKGNPLTQRINQTDVKTTVTWLDQMLPGLDLMNNMLGSTGLKPTSGDLDLAIDANKFKKDDLVAALTRWALSHKQDPKDWIKKSGVSVHFKTPINGRPSNGFVQTDFMFLPNVPFSKFILRSDVNSAYKGVTRNVMINSMAKSLGYKLNMNSGLANRATNEIITDNPDELAKILLNKTATAQDLGSVESIMKALKNDPKREAKIADFREHMAREGQPFKESLDTPYQEYSEVNFMARLRDRIVNQGMQVIVEAEVKGGRAKGIEHLEDYVFRNGSAGIKKALNIVKEVVANTPKTTTAKWDGKPALIFGRDSNGTFILTDVAAFTAVGYNGLFASPKQVLKHLAARDAEARAQGKKATRVQDLGPIYVKLWPMLDAAVPKNYRGFVHGDLLYTQTPPLEAGNYVFKPNTIEYKIPAASDVGRRIGNSEVGIAMHTRYAEPGAPKEPIGSMDQFKKVPGLLLLEPVYAKENVRPNSQMLAQLRDIYRNHGSDIDQLFNPAELSALKITDLPKLCIDYINSRVGVGFDNLLAGFGPWLQQSPKITPGKFARITEYLQSPRSNLDGMAAAFTAWGLLHDVKMDVLQQLDLQHPGQEGWVMATSAGLAKAVSRLAGGFAAGNRALNNPERVKSLG
jgi:hypothetical protein